MIFYFIIFIDIFALSILFPVYRELVDYYYQKELYHIFFQIFKNKEISFYGGILSGLYAFCQFYFSIFWGNLSDIFGRKKTLKWTSLGLFLSFLPWALGKTFSFLLLSRIFMGVFSGNISVASAALVDKSENKTKTLGFIGMIIGIAFILGPYIGSLTYENKNFPFEKLIFIQFFAYLINAILALFIKESEVVKKIRKSFNPFASLNNFNRKIKILYFSYFLLMILFSSIETSLVFYTKTFLQFNPQDNGKVFLMIGFLLVFFQGFVVRKIKEESFFLMLSPVSIFISILLFLMTHKIYFLFSLIFFSFAGALINATFGGFILKKIKGEEGLIVGTTRGLASLARAIAPFVFALFYQENIYFYLVIFFLFGIVPTIVFTLTYYEEKKRTHFISS